MRRNGMILVLAMVATVVAGRAFASGNPHGPGHYSVVYGGVSYDLTNGTSTFSYTVNWTGEPPALSHFGVQFCSSIKAADIVSASPGDWSVGIDSSLAASDCDMHDFYGIKWNAPAGFQEADEGAPRTGTFTFTVRGLFAEGPVLYAAKASTYCNLGQTTGPALSCRKMPALTITKTCPDDLLFGEPAVYNVTVKNIGEVPLTNVAVTDEGAQLISNPCSAALASGQSTSCQYSKTPADTQEDSDSTSISNTASVTASDTVNNVTLNALVDDHGTCSTRFWRLRFPGQSLSTSFTRSWTWTISKSGNGETVTIPMGSSGSVPFTINISSSHNDHDYTVSGSFTVRNPSPNPAVITSATVYFSSTGTSTTATCVPTTIAAGGGLSTCTYTKNLGSNSSAGTATITIALASGGPFSSSANYSFDNATRNDDNTRCVTVTDTPAGVTGLNAGAPQVFGPYCDDTTASIPVTVTVSNNGVGCDEYRTITNTASLSGGATISTQPVSATIYTGRCGGGCTLTIGYWKTHAGFTGRNPDRVTQYLPIWLGNPLVPLTGNKSVQVVNAGMAVQVLSMSYAGGEPSNGVTKLMAQLLGAKLNVARGASPAAIATTLANADALLAVKNQADWAGMSKLAKTQVLSYMTALDSYNNGLTGPGHCN